VTLGRLSWHPEQRSSAPRSRSRTPARCTDFAPIVLAPRHDGHTSVGHPVASTRLMRGASNVSPNRKQTGSPRAAITSPITFESTKIASDPARICSVRVALAAEPQPPLLRIVCVHPATGDKKIGDSQLTRRDERTGQPWGFARSGGACESRTS